MPKYFVCIQKLNYFGVVLYPFNGKSYVFSPSSAYKSIQVTVCYSCYMDKTLENLKK